MVTEKSNADRLYKILRANLKMEEHKLLAEEMALSVNPRFITRWENKIVEIQNRPKKVKKHPRQEAMELAEKLKKYVLELFPHYEKTAVVVKWADDIEKIPGQDRSFTFRTVDVIIEWLFTVDTNRTKFWKTNIRSAANLRKHFRRLYDDAKADFEAMKTDEV